MAPASNLTCFSISPIGIFSLCNSLYLHTWSCLVNFIILSQHNTCKNLVFIFSLCGWTWSVTPAEGLTPSFTATLKVGGKSKTVLTVQSCFHTLTLTNVWKIQSGNHLKLSISPCSTQERFRIRLILTAGKKLFKKSCCLTEACVD